MITGEDVELTCIGRGFPLVAVDVDASEAHDDLRIIVSRETVTEPTSTEPFIVSRTLTFRRVTVRDCMSVKCTVSSAVAGERTVESQIIVSGEYLYTCCIILCYLGGGGGADIHENSKLCHLTIV